MKKLYRIADSKQIFFITIGFVFSLSAYFVLKQSIYTLTVFISLIILFLYSNSQKKNEEILADVFFGILLFVIIKLLYQLFLTYFVISEWDFPGFYLFGKAGVSGLPFYDPKVFFQLYNHLNLSDKVSPGFISEIVNVGFWYPPPSMFLFLPLGLFKLQTAYFIWQSILILFLIIDVFLLIKYYCFEKTEGYNKNISRLFLLSLILFYPGFISSIQIAQTVFIFLFLLILLLENLDNWKGGLFLALLIIIKPLAALFALYFLLFKKWKIFVSFLLSGFVIIAVSMLFFGVDSFLTFFKSPPTNRIPSEIFYESTIQSVSAVLLRLQLNLFGFVEFKTIKIVVYVLGLFMILITTYCSFLTSKKDRKLAFIIFIPLALIIYPNTLISYTIISLPVILYLFSKNYFKNSIINVLMIFVLYGICHYSFFLFNLTIWVIFIAASMQNRFNLFPNMNSRFKMLPNFN